MVLKSPGAIRSDSHPHSQLTPFTTDPQRELAEPAAGDQAAQIYTAAEDGAYLIEHHVDHAVVGPAHGQPRPAQIAPYAGRGQPISQPPPRRAVISERPPPANHCAQLLRRRKQGKAVRLGRADDGHALTGLCQGRCQCPGTHPVAVVAYQQGDGSRAKRGSAAIPDRRPRHPVQVSR